LKSIELGGKRHFQVRSLCLGYYYNIQEVFRIVKLGVKPVDHFAGRVGTRKYPAKTFDITALI